MACCSTAAYRGVRSRDRAAGSIRSLFKFSVDQGLGKGNDTLERPLATGVDHEDSDPAADNHPTTGAHGLRVLLAPCPFVRGQLLRNAVRPGRGLLRWSPTPWPKLGVRRSRSIGRRPSVESPSSIRKCSLRSLDSRPTSVRGRSMYLCEERTVTGRGRPGVRVDPKSGRCHDSDPSGQRFFRKSRKHPPGRICRTSSAAPSSALRSSLDLKTAERLAANLA